MIAALLLADLALVVSVSTFAMLIFYLIANIAALRLPREHRQYPSWIPAMGALSCIGLIIFLSPVSWVIGCIGLLIGGTWFYFHRNLRTDQNEADGS
jgi:APA family basic amino acid/polyamine antiporter